MAPSFPDYYSHVVLKLKPHKLLNAKVNVIKENRIGKQMRTFKKKSRLQEYILRT